MKTVLLVEDSTTDRNLMSQYLKENGCVVLNAASVEEANTKLQQQVPDLIILDVILPGQSGFELCREIKKDPTLKKIPVVICSTKNTDVDKMWGNMLGADAYLSKPVNSDELKGLLARLM
ncbi:MAG: response regulator [Jaaginema sp. PMC 1079.18]|nr:response regulator [Jaaginema sp. PMC 1080.18]MEC4853160.1 response regulator [Jaaginema sp. PMC 1079.18]MEC4866817.1 response regulator [Jaaginema sp. PMC 1078.18]